MSLVGNPECAHCGQQAVYAEPHEIWCVSCGGYFDGEPPWSPRNHPSAHQPTQEGHQ